MNEADTRSTLRRWVDNVLWRAGYNLQRLRPEERRRYETSYDTSVPLPPDALNYLRGDNPRLLELQQAYASLGWPVCVDSYFWNANRVKSNVALPWFRGDNAYVWQYRQMGADLRLKRYIAMREVDALDPRGLVGSLDEDGLFGCWTETYGERPISRDLLDSVAEINFLDRHMGLFGQRQLRVLDIGAGYGRLAYRMSKALPNLVRYDCIDAVPESTFLSEYYLRFRGVTPPARAVPLHQIDSGLSPDGYDLVLNVHSFPECTYAAIAWWMERIKALNIPWFLLVPNDEEKMLSAEPDGSLRDFSPLIREAGYELVVKEPVYPNPEARRLIGVLDHYFLFRRRT